MSSIFCFYLYICFTYSISLPAIYVCTLFPSSESKSLASLVSAMFIELVEQLELEGKVTPLHLSPIMIGLY